MLKFLVAFLFVFSVHAQYVGLPVKSGGSSSSTSGTSPFSVLGGEEADAELRLCTDDADDPASDCWSFLNDESDDALEIGFNSNAIVRFSETDSGIFIYPIVGNSILYVDSNNQLQGASLNADSALVTNGSGLLASSATTATQVGYLSTLSSNVQTQLDAKQAIYDPTLNIDRFYYALCDFVEDDRCTWTAATNAGGGSGQAVTASTTGMNSTENALGVMDLVTGTGTTARAALVSAGNLRLGSQALTFYGRATVSALSDGTNTYITSIGFIDSTGAGDSTDGLYFRYSSANNSGEYECVTADGGSIAAADSNVAPSATVYDTFTIISNEAGTSVSYYINGVSVCGSPITGAGLPDTSDFFVMGAKIEKTLGATSRTLSVDYMGLEATRASAR